MKIQVKEGGTSLHKTIRKINLVYKGLKLTLQYGLGGSVANDSRGTANVIFSVPIFIYLCSMSL